MTTCQFVFLERPVELHATGLKLMWHSIKPFLGNYVPRPYGEIVSLPEKATILDVGANIGAMTALFTIAYPGAAVHAIEPSSYNYPMLQKTTSIYPNVTAHQFAAHDSDGELTIALPTKEQGMVSTSGNISVYGKSDNYRERVPAHRLDDVFEQADFIKIDAEGHTISILRGASRLLMEHRPVLQIEARKDAYDMAGVTQETLNDFIHSIGYRVEYRIDGMLDLLLFPK